jgi:glycosyltransferase involved in cell wall biosynthesis
MLTDSPPDFDRRVLDALARHGRPPLMVIPRRTSRAWRWASLLLALVALPVLLLRFGRSAARWGLRMRGGYGSAMSGLRACVLLQAASLAFFWSQRGALRCADLIYAHDQMAGVAAWLARKIYGVPYVYDAHEIVPFRARQTGLARMLLEYGWERAIVGASRRCTVVNRPMRRIYRHLYGTADYEIRTNDFFPQRELALDPAGPRLVVYIGAVGRHRGLEHMAELAAAHGAGMLCFCSNVGPEASALPAAELHGLAGYEERLLLRAAGAAPYLWCGFDTDVLSYRYALPNKFFQAMALGIPILAAPGSYLGRLVVRHGLGLVAGARAEPWSPETYARCARAMAAFRTAYRLGEVSI